MIIHKKGIEIDTEDKNNNHLYTYVLNNNLVYKVEVNFDLKEMESFLEIIKESGVEQEGFVENIEYDRITNKPISERPYDHIIDFLYNPNDLMESKTLLGKNIIKKVYLKWIEYPSIYHELKKIVEFKFGNYIDKTKDINLDYYVENLKDINLDNEFIDMLEYRIIGTLSKNKLEELNDYQDNLFINMNKQIEIANKYLEYGRKNYRLINKLK